MRGPFLHLNGFLEASVFALLELVHHACIFWNGGNGDHLSVFKRDIYTGRSWEFAIKSSIYGLVTWLSFG